MIQVNFSRSVFHWQFLIIYILSLSLKIGACYITGQWGRVLSKERYFVFTCTFSSFFFCVFHQKICVLIILNFFDKEPIIRNRILANQKQEFVDKY